MYAVLVYKTIRGKRTYNTIKVSGEDLVFDKVNNNFYSEFKSVKKYGLRCEQHGVC